ncbi:ABC transporter permease [Herbidospora mongoliensis]|uniref:ABC transporter permease n=1 Tax=Herbidospora mongoliensis TaxID=688067 RepID=UPI000834CB07|nr:ABC transporter permease [Herbidospora mongoliensis]
MKGELSKLASLWSVWLAGAVAVLVPTVITWLNSFMARGAGPDRGYQELAFGVMGVIILGVVAVSSEYATEGPEAGGGRQITTSLTAVPSRLRFLAAKAAAVALVAALLAVVAMAGTMSLAAGSSVEVTRLAGVVCYWTYTALLAFGITVLVRHGVVPLVVLLVNTSLVSMTFLLSKTFPVFSFTPDMAGARMFVEPNDSTVDISPLLGFLTMSGWVVVVLVIAAVVFTRRDA